MAISKLATYVQLSPNYTKMTNKKNKKITIHHVAGITTAKNLGALFAKPARQASSNYGIGNDGTIGCYVDEDNRSWCSSSRANDEQAITIEVSNSTGAPDWKVSNAAMKSLIALCVDICKRNNITELNFTNDTSGNLTLHRMFAATVCPGPYLESKIPYIVKEVNAQLKNNGATANKKVIYRVQVGAFSKRENADNMLKKLQSQGYTDAFIQKVEL